MAQKNNLHRTFQAALILYLKVCVVMTCLLNLRTKIQEMFFDKILFS